MITKNNKLKLIKPMGILKSVGSVFDIVNIDEKGTITFGCSPFVLGCMSYNEMYEYFEVIEPVKPKRVWTEWKHYQIEYRDIKGYLCLLYIYYRHNGTRVQVKSISYNVKSESCCHAEDKFDLNVGLKLAVMRLKAKIHAKEVEKYAKEL